MANRSLTDLTARTDTVDTDLMHINSGGTDYQETKLDFLRGSFGMTWADNVNVTTQADNLTQVGTFIGSLPSYGHQAETGVPVNSTYYMMVQRSGDANMIIYLVRVATGEIWFKLKSSGTWQASWTKFPTREEMDRIASDLAAITAGSSKTFTVANNSRILLLSTGGADSRCGIWHIFVASTGGVVVSAVGTPGTYISVSSSGNNTIVVSNTTSGSGSAYINAIVFAGSIT